MGTRVYRLAKILHSNVLSQAWDQRQATDECDPLPSRLWTVSGSLYRGSPSVGDVGIVGACLLPLIILIKEIIALEDQNGLSEMKPDMPRQIAIKKEQN